MNEPGNVIRSDDAVEALLEKAAPRPVPPAKDERIVREAVRAEWQAVTGRHRTRRRMRQFAFAATVLLGVVIGLNSLRVTSVQPVQVATIDNDRGSIYLVGEQSLLEETSDLSAVYAGQVIETGDDAGLSLSWGNGGSLRIDEKSRVEFRSENEVYLRSGQVYYDSGQPMAAITGSAVETMAAISGSSLEIDTEFGRVRHLGTQYMTTVAGQDLVVRVREGRVAVDGAYTDEAVAEAGQQMTLTGGARSSTLAIDGHGATWAWVEELAPVVDMQGRSTYEFLQRVSRETGLALEFESPEAEARARAGELRGTIEADPRTELALRMAGEDLDYRIDGGSIYVSIERNNSR